jgi:hypothetical protein
MGFRFRRSIRILPGIRLNLSKSGLGISAGPRGLKVGIEARGKKYFSAGIPGTGLSSRQYLKSSPVPSTSPQLPVAAERRAEDEPARATGSRPFLWIVAAGVLLAGLAVSVTRRDQPVTSPTGADLSRTIPSPGPTPEQAAVVIARGALSREHPRYALDRITTAGAAPVRRTPAGFNVRLQYRTRAGAALPYECKVAQQVGTCVARAAIVPTPGGVSGLHIGSRGGVYHYSSSGRKVYERR